MRKIITAALFLSAVLNLKAWGFLGHRIINETAVYSVPKPLFGFYKANIAYLKQHATDPDMRRYVLESEACKHFLDGDHYEKALPFDTLPKKFHLAMTLYGKDSLMAHGIVTWNILFLMDELTEAFRMKQKERILKLSADLGHYVGDCHVPLHSTSNYNGQKTGQTGIHSLWESRLTELYSSDFDLFCGMARYSVSPSDSVWSAFEESHRLVNTVLSAEKLAREGFEPEALYVWEAAGNRLKKVPSKLFSERYQIILGDMVERRMRASVLLLADLWYTAWVNAGQPDLGEESLPENGQDVPLKEPENGRILGREED